MADEGPAFFEGRWRYRRGHRYEKWFRDEVVEYATEHPEETLKKIGDQYGVHESVISTWMGKDKVRRRKEPYLHYGKGELEAAIKYAGEHSELSVKEVAEMFKVNPNTLATKVVRELDARKRISSSRLYDAYMYARAHPELTQEHVADKFQLSISALSKYFQSIGFKREYTKPYTEADVGAAVQYAVDNPGPTYEAISTRFNIPYAVIRAYMKAHNIVRPLPIPAPGVSLRGRGRSPFTEEKAQTIEKAIKTGEVSITQMANLLGVSYSAVWSLLNKRGKKP